MPIVQQDQSKTCFVFTDEDGGFVIKMIQPDGKPLEHKLDMARAARLQMQLSEAIAIMAGVRTPAPVPVEKYFQT